MAPRKKEEEIVEDNIGMEDVVATPAEPDDGEGKAGSDKEDSEDGDGAAGIDGQSDDVHTLVEAETKKKRSQVLRTPEERAATAARTAAATEALLSDRFVWKNGKPEPFKCLGQGSSMFWTRWNGESHFDYVDRLRRMWERLEQDTRGELVRLRDSQLPIPLGDDGEVEFVSFVWMGRNVRCETFINVDLSDRKDSFKSSKILSDFDEKMADYDELLSQDKEIRAEVVQYLVASKLTVAKLAAEKGIKDLIESAYEEIDTRERHQWGDWIEDGKRALRGEVVAGFPKGKGVYQERYTTVTKSWEDWGSGGREWTKDKKINNDRNLFASDPENGILRRPSVNGDIKAIYIAFDKNGKVIAFLDPQGIPWSYNKDVHSRMKDDSHEFYSTIKAPNPKSNKRHLSQREHLKENTELKSWWCGSDHYGHWHAQQHTKDPILETSDSNGLNATQRQLLLQFLKYTGGPMTRVLDFWFGVWEPQLRQRYRDIYAKSPEFARLPPVNKDHPETYCLRVSVCNRPTDEHRDQNDIRGGLTGLVHLGDFKGAAMCINKLGIALDGYGDGAVLLFRGTEMKHYISQWSGNYRYAFDHTTHQSVEDAIKEHEKTGRWGPKKDATAPKGPKGGKGGRKSKKPDDKDDGQRDGGDASSKPQEKPKKRKRGNDTKETDGAPPSKRFPGNYPTGPTMKGQSRNPRLGADQNSLEQTDPGWSIQPPSKELQISSSRKRGEECCLERRACLDLQSS